MNNMLTILGSRVFADLQILFTNSSSIAFILVIFFFGIYAYIYLF